MAFVIAILISFALLLAFLSLTYFEASHGVRLLGGLRRRLDRRVGQATFILQHVDLAAFLRDTLREVSERLVHDVAHATLIAVRFVERLLTRVVRHQRGLKEEKAATPKRSFREAVQHVKSTVRLRRLNIKDKEGAE